MERKKPKQKRVAKRVNLRVKPKVVKKPERQLLINADPSTDRNVLPAQMGKGALTRPSLNTLDRLAEDVGGRHEFVNMCRLSDDPKVMEFVRKCEIDREVTLENIIDHMNLKVGEILKSVVPAMHEHGMQVSKLINALNSPKVMKQSLATASLIGQEGFADRKMQLEIAGLVQRSGGISVVGNMNVNSGGVERPEATYMGTATRVDDEGDDAA